MDVADTTADRTQPALRLWQHILGEERGLLQIWTGLRSPDGRIPPESIQSNFFRYPELSRDAAEWALEKSEEGRETYFCAHLLTAPKRTKEHAAGVCSLWFEQDGGKLPSGHLKPSAVVQSSPGNFHGYLRLTDTIPAPVAEQLNERLTHAIGADPSGYDLTQLLRVPGTKNHKYEDHPVVELLGVRSNRMYSTRDLDEQLPKVESSRQAAPVEDRIPHKKRNKTLTSLAGSMRRRGMEEEELAVALLAVNERRCDPPLEEDEVRGIARSIARYEPAGDVIHISFNGHGGLQPPRFNLTDLGNAERFIAHHGEDVRYCYPWRKWLVWTGARWERDEAGRVYRLAKETVRGIYREASDEEDEDRRKALGKHARASESETRIRAMVELAKPEIPVSPDELDASPWLLNTANGTIDLRTGELREHRREDLITKVAPVEYDPAAAAPTWEAFLERVLPGEELRQFVQRAVGYSATGSTSEQCMFIHHGPGANGKSTFAETLSATLGDYAMRTPTETLLVKRPGGVPNDVARLKGARYVTASETEEGRRLAESLVKDLTGQDTISARFMWAEWFDFKPTHALHLSTNHRPEIRGSDAAIWRRIRLVPWSVTIPPAEQDRKLPEKLRAELPGVLTWIVRGCLEWQREGLQAPEEVRQATKAYRAEMDVLAAFLADCCLRAEDETAFAGDLWGAWKRWCEESGEQAGTQKRFGGRLAERGFLNHRDSRTGRKVWSGVALRSNWESRAGISLNHSNVRFAGNSERTEPSEPKNNNLPQESSREETLCEEGSEGSEGSVEERRTGNELYKDRLAEFEREGL
jgi:P4 family phage/plasmid primase-like protien